MSYVIRIQLYLIYSSLDVGIHKGGGFLSSISPSAAYMCQLIGSALDQIMACRLFGAKPLSKPMLGYCQLDPREQTSVKF